MPGTQSIPAGRRARTARIRVRAQETRARGAIGYSAKQTGLSGDDGNSLAARPAWRLTPNYEILSRDVSRAVEAAVLALTVWLAGLLHTGFVSAPWSGAPWSGAPWSGAPWSGAGEGARLLAVAVFLLSFFVLPRREADRGVSPSLNAAALLTPLALLLLLSAAAAALTRDGFPPLGFLLLWAGLAFPALLLVRALHRAHVRALRRAGVLRERIAILSCDAEPEEALAHVVAAASADIELAGMFHAPAEDWSGQSGAEGRSNHPGLDALAEQARREPVDRVIVVARTIHAPGLEKIVVALRGLDVDASLLCLGGGAAGSSGLGGGAAGSGLGGGAAGSSGLGGGAAGLDRDGGAAGLDMSGAATGLDMSGAAAGGPLRLELLRRPLRGWSGFLKSAEDRVIALLLMPLALPLMALIALAIRLDSKGPVLFRQSRHGQGNAEFRIFKFRTMEWRGEALATGARQTQRGDARVTRVGRLLRAASLDELPQLFNVLRGEMSIVGPRPHPVMMRTENRLGHEIAPDYAHRHRVRPGLTGLAQINGSRGAMETAGQLRHRVEHDLRYIDNWSLSLDLGILALTPIRLLWHRGKAF